jgi:hypothetical protein
MTSRSDEKTRWLRKSDPAPPKTKPPTELERWFASLPHKAKKAIRKAYRAATNPQRRVK